MRHPDTIVVEDAKILDHQSYPAGQYVVRMRAPKCALRAKPGNFVHLQCNPLLPMRRPFSIMRAAPEQAWIEVLYKVVGTGTNLLSERSVGETISLLGPIGNHFKVDQRRPQALLIGGGVGIPPMIYLADTLRRNGNNKPLVLMGSEVPFPFQPRPSQILVPQLPQGVIAAMPLLDDWGIPSRLASLQGYSGCFHGYVTDLARSWLEKQSQTVRREIEIFACGPHAMLAAVSALAREHELPCQVSLEEYMACAVGGCAGCAVLIKTPSGPAMKRVCVDGPVFTAASVF